MKNKEFNYELKRKLLYASTILSILIAFFAAIYGSEDYFEYGYGDFIDVFNFSIISGTSSVLALFAPILVCLPMAQSFIEEEKSGYSFICISKMGYKKYFKKRIGMNAVIVGLTLAIPSFMFLILTFCFKGIGKSKHPAFDVIFAKEIYEFSGILYVMLMIINLFIFGAVFATLGLGIASICKNAFLGSILPFIYMLFSMIFLNEWNVNLNANRLFSLNECIEGYNISIWFIYYFILIMIGIGLYIKGFMNYDR